MAPPDTPDTLLVISASMTLTPPDSENPLPSLHTPCSSAPRLCVSAFTVEVASVAASNPSRWSSLTRVANRAPFSAKRRLADSILKPTSTALVDAALYGTLSGTCVGWSPTRHPPGGVVVAQLAGVGHCSAIGGVVGLAVPGVAHAAGQFEHIRERPGYLA